jgi:cell division initiation protein
MSAELDVPSPEQIRRRMFASIPHGFDPDEVRDFLEHIADRVIQLERGLREARIDAENARSDARGALDAANRRVDAAERRVAELEANPPQQDAYQDVSGRLAGLLRSADEQSEKLLAEARSDANHLIAEARLEADRVRGEAQVRAEQARSAGDEALRRARSEADRAIAGLAERRTVLVTQLQEMQARLMGVAQDLDSTVVAMAPGLWLQRGTTNAPDDGQVDVEVAAFGEVLRVESEGLEPDRRLAGRPSPPTAEVDLSGGESWEPG